MRTKRCGAKKTVLTVHTLSAILPKCLFHGAMRLGGIGEFEDAIVTGGCAGAEVSPADSNDATIAAFSSTDARGVEPMMSAAVSRRRVYVQVDRAGPPHRSDDHDAPPMASARSRGGYFAPMWSRITCRWRVST